jgi:large subunit ribosomal protein L28
MQLRRQNPAGLPGPISRCYNDEFKRRERFCFMAKVCEVCGRGPQFGNRISHAHNVTKRRWNVNLQSVRALVNGAGKRLRVCASCIRDGKIQKVA